MITLPDRKSFGSVLDRKFEEIGSRQFVYQVKFVPINFITVTMPPGWSHLFPRSTCLLVSVISVSGFLEILTINEASQNSLTCHLATIVDKFIAVTCIFLGQDGESSGSACHTRKITMIILIIWLFGNFILMSNFYQGSIYSCLAVLFPPETPRDVETLAKWNIPMVAMDKYDLDTGEQQTLLHDDIIPKLISNGTQNPISVKFLTEFKAQLLSYNNRSVLHMVNKILYENSTLPYPMVAFLIANDWLEFNQKLVIFSGNRHVARSKGDTPFQSIFWKTGSKSLLSPYFMKDWRNMLESGLPKVWTNLHMIAATLRRQNLNLMHNQRFGFVQCLFDSLKEAATFHEAQRVSLLLIMPTFYLCAVVLGFGVIGFAVENTKSFKHVDKTIVISKIFKVFCRIEKFCKD